MDELRGTVENQLLVSKSSVASGALKTDDGMLVLTSGSSDDTFERGSDVRGMWQWGVEWGSRGMWPQLPEQRNGSEG